MSDFPLPSGTRQTQANRQFLASGDATYSYGDLQCFTQNFCRCIDQYSISQKHPLAIWAEPVDLTFFVIAACWQQHIPFICLKHDEKPATLHTQIHSLQPVAMVCNSFSGIENDPEIPNIIELDLSNFLKNEKNENFEAEIKIPKRKKDPIFSYFFTSGTSGQPKIVPLNRRQIFAAAKASAKNIKPAPNNYWLACLPLHHVGGVSLILRSLLYGSAIYRLGKFQTSKVATLLSEHKSISAASLVPTMLNRLLHQPSFKTHDDFQGILLGGGPVSSSLLKECIRRDIAVISSFGMTETCAQIAANPINKTQNFDAVGQIFEPNRVEIRDETGTPCPTPKPGIIWLKGQQVFDGYFSADQNRNAFDKDGWFNTGDFGYLDDNKKLYIEARRTDLIVTGGENVLPFEVEAELVELHGVKEAAVFGVADQEWGHRVVAAVVLKSPQNYAEEELRSALRENLSAFKIPKQFIFVDELPRTQNGKIRRGELLRLYE